MNGEINFIQNKANHQARFINNNMQADKTAAQPSLAEQASHMALKSANRFIEQSAKNLYQFFANAQSAQMKGQEMSLVLKDLLNMQKDMEAFLANMTNGNTAEQLTKADIAKILINSGLDLSKLKAFMQESGKESLAKLFNMTADFAQSGAVARSSQMSELIAILKACTPNADTTQVQVLKNMMLLYLPWLPLGEQNFRLDISSGKKEEDEDESKEDSVSILLSTVNFGNVQILIYKTEKSSIGINIAASNYFPKDKVIEQIKNESKDYNIQTDINFEQKESLDNRKTNNAAETQVSVNTGKHINPFLILMAQTAIKIIIDFDKNITLVDTRKEKL